MGVIRVSVCLALCLSEYSDRTFTFMALFLPGELDTPVASDHRMLIKMDSKVTALLVGDQYLLKLGVIRLRMAHIYYALVFIVFLVLSVS